MSHDPVLGYGAADCEGFSGVLARIVAISVLEGISFFGGSDFPEVHKPGVQI